MDDEIIMSTRKTIPTPAQPSKPSPDNLSPLKAIEPPNPNPNQPTPQGTPPLKELVKQYDSVSLLLQGGGALGAWSAAGRRRADREDALRPHPLACRAR